VAVGLLCFPCLENEFAKNEALEGSDDLIFVLSLHRNQQLVGRSNQLARQDQ